MLTIFCVAAAGPAASGQDAATEGGSGYGEAPSADATAW